jgi:signal transduction protein with GAF and PtsI domain
VEIEQYDSPFFRHAREVRVDLDDAGRPKFAELLHEVLQRLDCTAGTIHLLEAESGLLKLAAAQGMPEVVLAKIGSITLRKGRAGIAAERREPVQVCNLQTDTSGVVRAGARDTKLEGSVAAPMIGTDGTLRGTVGVAKPVPYDFSAAECEFASEGG